MSTTATDERLLVEVWFDPVCPWCYLGEHRLHVALSRSEQRDAVRVRWRSFQLDPDAPREPGRTATQVMVDSGGDPARIAQRWERIHRLAAAEGIVIDMVGARPVNTYDAHRLVQLAQEDGTPEVLIGALMRSHHTHGRSIADLGILRELAEEAELDLGDVDRVLRSDAFGGAVRADRARAMSLGVDGVPTAVLDGQVRVPLSQVTDELLAGRRPNLGRASRPPG